MASCCSRETCRRSGASGVAQCGAKLCLVDHTTRHTQVERLLLRNCGEGVLSSESRGAGGRVTQIDHATNSMYPQTSTHSHHFFLPRVRDSNGQRTVNSFERRKRQHPPLMVGWTPQTSRQKPYNSRKWSVDNTAIRNNDKSLRAKNVTPKQREWQ